MNVVIGLTWGFEASAAVFKKIDSSGYVNLLFAISSERISRTKGDTDWRPAFKAALDYLKFVNLAHLPIEVVFFQNPLKAALHNSLQKPYLRRPRLDIPLSKELKAIHGSVSSVSHVDIHESHVALACRSVPMQDKVALCVTATNAHDFTSVAVWRKPIRGQPKLLFKEQRSLSPSLYLEEMAAASGFSSKEDFAMMATLQERRETFTLRKSVRSKLGLELRYIESDSIPFSSWWASNNVAYYIMNLISEFREGTDEVLACSGDVFNNPYVTDGLSAIGSFSDLQIYVPFNPGNSGAAIGCVLAKYAKHRAFFHGEKVLEPFLGRTVNRSLYVDEKSREEIANSLLAGRIVAVSTGKEEFGNRALGNRSLLALPGSLTRRFVDRPDASSEFILTQINRIKDRQPFWPISISFRESEFSNLFARNRNVYLGDLNAQYLMPLVINEAWHNRCPYRVDVSKQNLVCPHVVSAQSNPEFYSLLTYLKDKAQVPYILNTSFNLHSKPLMDPTSTDLASFYNRALTRSEVPIDFFVTKDEQSRQASYS